MRETADSVARLDGFLPSWAVFEHGLEKIAMGGLIKFGLLFTTFVTFIENIPEKILTK